MLERDSKNRQHPKSNHPIGYNKSKQETKVKKCSQVSQKLVEQVATNI